MSMCLVHTWYCPSLDSAIADWLSQWIVVVVVGDMAISPMKVHSHIASFIACAAMMYSASVVDSVIIGCFLELHVTAPPPQEESIARYSVSAAVTHGRHPSSHLGLRGQCHR